MAKVIYNRIIPFGGTKAITLWPFIFARKSAKWLADYVVNHEKIHLVQQAEVLAVSVAVMAVLCVTCLSWWCMLASPLVYFAWYAIEYVVRLFAYGRGHEAYKNVSFEQEAYLNERDMTYLENRKAFAWIKYLTKKTYRR